MTYTLNVPSSLVYTYFVIMTFMFIATMMFVMREARMWIREVGSIVIVPKAVETEK